MWQRLFKHLKNKTLTTSHIIIKREHLLNSIHVYEAKYYWACNASSRLSKILQKQLQILWETDIYAYMPICHCAWACPFVCTYLHAGIWVYTCLDYYLTIYFTCPNCDINYNKYNLLLLVMSHFVSVIHLFCSDLLLQNNYTDDMPNRDIERF